MVQVAFISAVLRGIKVVDQTEFACVVGGVVVRVKMSNYRILKVNEVALMA